MKGLSEMKGDVVKGVLAKEGSTFADIPAFFWQGLGIVDITQKEIMFSALRQAQMVNQQEQAAMQQQAMAQQQQAQGMPMQEGQPTVPTEQPVLAE